MLHPVHQGDMSDWQVIVDGVPGKSHCINVVIFVHITSQRRFKSTSSYCIHYS